MLFCAFLWTMSRISRAQENKIVIGETAVIHSAVLNEDRPIQIYLPPGYGQTKAKYQVAYLLDGNDHFIHASGIVQILAQTGLAPQIILIGIPNTKDRAHDLTPQIDTASVQFPTGGGADSFLKFLTDELVPFVDKTYRTEPYKILIGHSFGGLFAVHTLLTKPDAFDAYIAISPSLWWNHWSEVQSTQSFFKAHPAVKKVLYTSLGTEGDQMLNPMNNFAKILEKSAPKTFLWKYVPMPKENHGTTPHKTIYDALEWIYADWNFPQASLDSGLAGLEKHFAGLSEKFGYTIAPSENMVNAFGYALLAGQKVAESIRAFQYNVKNYPESANVYDSLADALEVNNELESARINCEKAVALGTKANDPNLSVYLAHLQKVKARIGLK